MARLALINKEKLKEECIRRYRNKRLEIQNKLRDLYKDPAANYETIQEFNFKNCKKCLRNLLLRDLEEGVR